MVHLYRLYLVSLIVILSNCRISGQASEAQHFRFRKYTVEEGLSQNSVTCLLQDRKGFIWAGTMDGLNRFDGHEFLHIKHQPGETAGLLAPYVNCLYEDTDGSIWIGTDRGGVSILDPYQMKIRSWKTHSGSLSGLSSDRVTGICKDQKGYYWISTLGGGLNRMDYIKGTFLYFRASEKETSISNDNIVNMIRSYDGQLYLATRNGLTIFNPVTHKVRRVFLDDKGNDADNRMQYVYEDQSGNIYVATFKKGLYIYIRGKEKLVPFLSLPPALQSPLYNSIFRDPMGRLWLAGNECGLVIYDTVAHNITSRRGEKGSLNVNSMQSFLYDRSGNLWIGSLGGGLHMWCPQNAFFSQFDNSLFDSLPPGSGNIFSITTDANKRVWFGTNGEGLFCYNPADKLLQKYLHDPGDSSSTSSNSVWSLCMTKDSMLTLGTFGEGVNLINLQNRKITRIRKAETPGKTTPAEIILHISNPSRDTLILGTMRTGLEILNTRTKSRISYSKSGEKPSSITSDYVYTTLKTRDGNLFIGMQRGGLCVLNRSRNNWHCYMKTEEDSFSLNNNDVQSIYEDINGRLWLGTNGGGLNVLERKSGHFLNYTEKDGLPNNVIYAITGDLMGQLWLSTNNGICCFTPPATMDFNRVNSPANKRIQIRNFSVTDGLSSNEFNQGAFHKDQDGKIYFGSVNGITSFYPERITLNKYQPPVYLTRFKVFEIDYLLDTNITYKKTITLRYDQNFFSFEFSALNYFLPEKCNYTVLMEGFDKNWVNTGTRRYVSYTNLDPGNYTFKVKATNNDGLWSDHIAMLQITITPPFWKTWWFKTGAQALIILLVFLFLHYRILKIKTEEKKKAAFRISLAEVEMKALRAQMNPHFIFNSLNSINSFILAHDSDSASSYLARFSRLIRLVFENSMHKTVPLQNDLEALDLYVQMEKLRFGNKINFIVTISPGIDPQRVEIPPLLIQPFVENALLHGILPKEKDGHLTISVTNKDDMLVIAIQDDGIGRQHAWKLKEKSGHKSYGIKVTRERIDLLNTTSSTSGSVQYTDLIDENSQPAGTLVEIRLPYELL